MHWLTKYTNKECDTCSDMHSIIILFNNHPYISSSKFSANWDATATYVEMYVGVACGCWTNIYGCY